MLNDALRLLRVYHDLTQRELAEKLEISTSHLSELETGKKNPTLQLLGKYAQVFEVSLSSLIFFAENMEKDVNLERARRVISSKIIALMKFIAERSERTHAD